MSIHFQINIDGDSVDEAIAEFGKVFGALVGATPAVAKGAVTAGTTAEVKTGEIIPPKKTRRMRGASTKDAAADVVEGEKDHDATVAETGPLADASSAETTESASTSSTEENPDTSASTASSEEVPDLDLVRTKLKHLGATDGLGRDKVFEVLGKYGAKNASTVPEDKRAAVIAEINELITGVK